MTINPRDLERQVKTSNTQFEAVKERPRGEVVAVDGDVTGPGGIFQIWIRPLEPNATPHLMFNPGAVQQPLPGMTVHQARWPTDESPWRMLEFDISTYAGDFATLITLPGNNIAAHGTTHQMAPGSIGSDPTQIFTHAITDFSVRPTSPFSMKVQIQGGWYKAPLHSGTGVYTRFLTQQSEDLTARVPTLTGKAKLVAICLDPVTGLVVYIEGTEYTFEADPFPAAAFPSVTSTLILLTDVLLSTGMTQITSIEFEKERRPLFGSTAAGTVIDDAVHWLVNWRPIQYNKNDMVRDGDWAMIANATTTDRAAPQPVGAPDFVLPDAPTFTPATHTGFIAMANEFTMTDGLFSSSRMRYRVKQTGASYSYQVIVEDITDTGAEFDLFTSEVFVNPPLGWNELDTDVILTFVAGRSYRLMLFAINTASTTPVSGQWVRDENSQAGQPALGEWLQDNQSGRLVISKTDNAAADRTAELAGFVAGTSVTLTDNAIPAISVDWVLDSGPTDLGSSFEWAAHITSGSVPAVGSLDDLDATVPVAGSTDIEFISGHWTTSPPDHATARGIFSLDGGSETITDDAFGVDMLVQEFTISPFWDLLAYSGGIGVAGVGGGVDTWLALLDTPGSFVGQSLQGVRVNVGETALEFVAFPTVIPRHIIEEEGTPLTDRPTLNFIGANVTAADDAGNDATTITVDTFPTVIPRHIIEEEGSPLPDQPNLNFVGADVTVTDDGPGTTTVVTLDPYPVVIPRHIIQDEGGDLADEIRLDFVGAGVTATDGVGITTVTIPGTVAIPRHIIEEEGVPLTDRPTLNFIGADFTAADDVGNDATTITLDPFPTVIPRHIIQDEGGDLADQIRLNFVGAGVTATDGAGVTTVTIPATATINGHVIQEEGTPLTQRANLNFAGAGVIATDDAGNSASLITISGAEWTRVAGSPDKLHPNDLTDIVGIGIATPDPDFHVHRGSAGGVASHSSSVVTVENSSSTYMTLLAPDANEKAIFFGGPISNIDGGIVYNNVSTSRGFEFRTGGNVTQMAILSTGLVGIGTTSPQTDLHVLESGVAGTPAALGQNVAIFQRSVAAGDFASIAIVSGNTGQSRVDFGDTDDIDAGVLAYIHSEGSFAFVIEGADIPVKFFGTRMDWFQNEMQHMVVHPVATPPSVATEVDGQIYYDTVADDLFVWTGAAWTSLIDSEWTRTTGATDFVFPNNFGSTFVGVNTDTPEFALDVKGDFRIFQDGGTARFDVSRASNDALAPASRYIKSRGTHGTPTVVSTGDVVGQYTYLAYDGALFEVSGLFRVLVDGTVSSGVVPGRFSIQLSNLSGVSKDVLTIKADGRTGMGGVITPSAQLQILSATNEILRLDSVSSTANLFATFYQNGTLRALIQLHNTNKDFRFISNWGDVTFRTGTAGTATERLTILGSGDIGVAKAAPTHTFELGDDDAAKTATTTWATTSDIRTKKNITPYTLGLDFLKILPAPIRFEYNGAFGTVDGLEAIGFRGQDLHALGTSLTRVDARGVINFTSHELFFIYVNGFKDVAVLIEDNTSEITVVKEEITKLKSKLKKLKKELDDCCDEDNDNDDDDNDDDD